MLIRTLANIKPLMLGNCGEQVIQISGGSWFLRAEGRILIFSSLIALHKFNDNHSILLTKRIVKLFTIYIAKMMMIANIILNIIIIYILIITLFVIILYTILLLKLWLFYTLNCDWPNFEDNWGGTVSSGTGLEIKKCC